MNEIEVMEVALMRTQVPYKRVAVARAAYPSATEALEVSPKRGTLDKFGHIWMFDVHGVLVGVEISWLT